MLNKTTQIVACILLFFIPTIVNATTPTDEVEIADNFLMTIPQEQREFIRFFTTYSIPELNKIKLKIGEKEQEFSLRDAVARFTLPFWIHSLSSERIIRQPAPVPNSNTLYYIDLRNYNWTGEAWEKVALLDPYFVKPVVDPKKYDSLRYNATGNAIIRADWFIIHTSDVTKQIDRGIKDPLYYELLYAKSGVPKTVDEFRQRWGVDMKKIQGLGTIRKNFVDRGKSGVSHNNRDLYRTRTELGYYWETEDVLNMQQGKDYLENLKTFFRPAQEKDAGEMITNNQLGLQVYFLSNGKGERVEFGDSRVVEDKGDQLNTTVRTAKSCVLCHAGGINIPPNSLKEKLDRGISINFKTNDNLIDYEGTYLDPELFVLVGDDRELYLRAIRKVNGLEPEVNTYLFNETIKWYELPVDIHQAAIEAGVSAVELKERVQRTGSGRLSDLVTGGKIPRNVWDEQKNGVYAQCMLLVHNIPLQDIETKEDTTQNDTETAPTPTVIITQDSYLMSGTKKLVALKAGEVYNIVAEMDHNSIHWFKITKDNMTGFVNSKYVRANNK